jgi:hypothetical protein
MSTCYKCGKELPGVETECDPACGVAEMARPGEAPLMLSIGIFPRPEVFDDPVLTAEFARQVQAFMYGMAAAFEQSELRKFCERKKS